MSYIWEDEMKYCDTKGDIPGYSTGEIVPGRLACADI